MHPSIRLGDVAFVQCSRIPARVEDVVLIRGDTVNVIHRLLWVGRRHVVHSGDASFSGSVVSVERIVGRVVAVHRRGQGSAPGEIVPVANLPPRRAPRLLTMLTIGAALGVSMLRVPLRRSPRLRKALAVPHAAMWRAIGLSYALCGAAAPASGESADVQVQRLASQPDGSFPRR